MYSLWTHRVWGFQLYEIEINEKIMLLELLVTSGCGANITLSCTGYEQRPLVTASLSQRSALSTQFTYPKNIKQEREEFNENHVRWINEGQVMKGLQRIHEHRKSNKEQSGVCFNWKEASSHLSRSSASGSDVGVSYCQHCILMETR